MRTFRCRLAVSALLALVLGDALAMGADVVKIGAVFEDSKEVIFDGTQTLGWAANHAEAAAAAVARINSDNTILPGVELQLVRIHVEVLRAAAWMEGDCSRASERCFLRQFHDTEARGLCASLADSLANLTAVVGVGYSKDVVMLSPWLTDRKLMLMTHAAESSAISDKTRHPFVGRMSRANLKTQAHALVDVVQQVVKHTSVKLLMCDDAFCNDCAMNVRERARHVDVEIEQEITLSYQSFRNDAQGRTEVKKFLSDCSQARAVIMCTLAEQANEVFQAAGHLNLRDSSIWLVLVDTAVATDYYQSYPIGTLGLNLAPKSGKTVEATSNFSSHWESRDPASPGLQSLKQEDDPYVGFSIDAVYVVARALQKMRQNGNSLGNRNDLRNAIGSVSFQGVSGHIAFDTQLDPIESGRFDVVSFVSDGSWTTVGHLRNGTLQSTSAISEWPFTGLQMTPSKACCSISVGGLFAVVGYGMDYHDLAAYNAAQVAIRRIKAGHSLELPNGTSLGSILPNVNVALVLGDTSSFRSITAVTAEEWKVLKEQEGNQTMKNLIELERPVGFVGLGYSSEALISEKVLNESEKVVISHFAVNPRLADHPWFARTVADDSTQGDAIADLLKQMNVDTSAEIWIVHRDVNYYEGLRTQFLIAASRLNYKNATTKLINDFTPRLKSILETQCDLAKPVVVLAIPIEDVRKIQGEARDQELTWTNALWIGADEISPFGAEFPGYVGLQNRVSAHQSEDLKKFWTTDVTAQNLYGIDSPLLDLICRTHDAVWALLLAVHNVITAGGSASNGTAVREALRWVSFAGASGNISFTEKLDLADVSYDIVAMEGTQVAANGTVTNGTLATVGQYLNGKVTIDADKLGDLRSLYMRTCDHTVYRTQLLVSLSIILLYMAYYASKITFSLRLRQYAKEMKDPNTDPLDQCVESGSHWISAWILLFLSSSAIYLWCESAIYGWNVTDWSWSLLSFTKLPGNSAGISRDRLAVVDVLVVVAVLLLPAILIEVLFPRGWWVYTWADQIAESLVDKSRFNTKDEAGEDGKDENTHSLKWRFFKPCKHLKDTGVMSAMPKCLKSYYNFERLLYYRDSRDLSDSKKGWQGMEIVFEVSRQNKSYCLKLFCTKGYQGFDEPNAPEAWSAKTLAKREEIAALFAKDSTTREPGSAHLLMPTGASSTGYVHDWNGKFQGNMLTLPLNKLKNWLGFEEQLTDKSMYFIESKLPLPHDTSFETLSESMQGMSPTDAFRISLSIAQLLERLKEKNIVLYNLDPDTIVKGANNVYWVTDWSHAIWNPVRVRMTFAGMTEMDFDEGKKDKLRACIAEQVSPALEWVAVGSEKPKTGTEINDDARKGVLEKALFIDQVKWESTGKEKPSEGRVLTNPKLSKALVSKGADVNAADSDGTTPAMEAAQGGHKDTVEVLMEKGADVNAADSNGVTAVMSAAHGGHKDTVEVLVEKGADVNAATSIGVTAVMSAADFTREEWDTFGIQDLHTGDFIKSYDSYFKLVQKSEKIRKLSKEDGHKLGVSALGSRNSYLKLGETYFKPAAVSIAIDDVSIKKIAQITQATQVLISVKAADRCTADGMLSSLSHSSFIERLREIKPGVEWNSLDKLEAGAEVILTSTKKEGISLGIWDKLLSTLGKYNKVGPDVGISNGQTVLYGKPAAIAPELLRAVHPCPADAHAVDPSGSAEVYSLGVFLYRLLTSTYPSFNINDDTKSSLKEGIRDKGELSSILKLVRKREAMFDRSLKTEMQMSESKSIAQEKRASSDLQNNDKKQQRSQEKLEEALKKTPPDRIFLRDLKGTNENGIFIAEKYELKCVDLKCVDNRQKLSIVEHGKEAWELQLSKEDGITFSARAKHYASIVDHAKTFAFCYPMIPSDVPNAEVGGETALGRLLREGGFVYFNAKREIVSIKSIQWAYTHSLLFDHLDLNNNGKLERSELDILGEVGWTKESIDQVFSALDFDSDGSISREELKRFVAETGEQTWRERSDVFIRLGIKPPSKDGDSKSTIESASPLSLNNNSCLRKIHDYDKIGWIPPNSEDPNNGGGTLVFVNEEGQTTCCPLWMGYLNWEGCKDPLPLDAKDLVASMLQVDAKQRSNNAVVCKRLERVVMMHELQEAIDEKKQEMEDILTDLPQDMHDFAFDSSNLAIPITASCIHTHIHPPHTHTHTHTNTAVSNARTCLPAPGLIPTVTHLQRSMQSVCSCLYPEAEEGKRFSREISDIFHWAQVTINEQELSSPKKPDDQISTNGSNDSNGTNKYNKALKTQVERLLCKQRMDKAKKDCICRQHQQTLAPAALIPRHQLTFGDAKEATKGLKAFTGLNDDKELGKLLHQGVRALQDEFIQNGSLQDLENFYYICYGIAQHKTDMPAHVKDDINKGKYHGGKLSKEEYDCGHHGMELEDFVCHKYSRLSELSEANVLGVRIYTTSSYANLNNPLRKQRLPHPFKMSVYHLDEGLRKLRTVAANKKKTFCKMQHLYRGICGRKMKTEELKESGGIERALMSTSNKRETAESYAKAFEETWSGGPRIIIEYQTEGLSTGTSIGFLSVYPTKEAEYLYPPLTRIKLEDHVMITQDQLKKIKTLTTPSKITPESLFDMAQKVNEKADHPVENNRQEADPEAAIMICKMIVQLS